MKRSVMKWRLVKDYLTFSRSEQTGVIVLLLVIILTAGANHLVPGQMKSPEQICPDIMKQVRAFDSECRKMEIRDSLIRFANRNFHGTKFPDLTGPEWKNKAIKEPSLLMDLNSADTLDLQRLKGIGPAFARRIVSYRKRLGGYTEISQLMEVYGIDTTMFQRLKEHFKVSKDSLHTIDLNSATFKELLRHPYFPYYLTRAIILYRQKIKQFNSVGELRNIEGISDSVFRKIHPYVKVCR